MPYNSKKQDRSRKLFGGDEELGAICGYAIVVNTAMSSLSRNGGQSDYNVMNEREILKQLKLSSRLLTKFITICLIDS